MNGFKSCYTCNPYIYFLSEESRNDHMKTTHDINLHKCRICNFPTFQESQLYHHLLQKHFHDQFLDEFYPSKCRHCINWLNSLDEAKTHVLRKHQIELIQKESNASQPEKGMN